MKQKLLTVSQSYMLSGHGLVVVPGPLVRDYPGPCDVHVEIRKPDGSRLGTVLSLMEVEFPSSTEPRWGCLFRQLKKADVPAGSELWWEAN